MPVVTKKKSSVAKANEKFAAMTKAQKRVAIARDVIKTLKAGKLVAERGTYLCIDPRGDRETSLTEEDVGGQWRDKLKKVETCTVCAKGAIFVTAALRSNRFKIDGSIGQDTFDDVQICELNERYFSKSQLAEIEEAFENSEAYWNLNQMDTMIAIMKNIIKNKGKFIVPQWNDDKEVWE